jgi:hypothetical protein
MLSNTRTTVITLAAVFSFGGAAVVPTLAQAATNESSKHEHMCANYEEEFNNYEDEAFNNELSAAERTQARKNAQKTAKAAIASGCDTASWRVQPASEGTPIQGLRPGGEPKSALEPSSQPARLTPLPAVGTLG